MKKRKFRVPRWCLILLTAIYAGIMLWLLFFMRIGTPHPGTYAEALASHFDPIPFEVIGPSVSFILRNPLSASFAELRILLGNFFLFVPIGWILPYYFPSCRRAWKLILVTMAIIAVVELTQAFTLLGFCDFDDLLLNTLGAYAGFLFYPLLSRILPKQNNEE